MTNSLQWLLSSSQGADPGFFSGGGASLMNGITDWCGKQVLKANTKKKALSQGRCAPPATNQLNLEPLTFRTLFKGSLMCLLYV